MFRKIVGGTLSDPAVKGRITESSPIRPDALTSQPSTKEKLITETPEAPAQGVLSTLLRPFKAVIKWYYLHTVSTDPEALRSAPQFICADPEVVLPAVKRNGLQLKYASDDLKKDKKLVLAAIENEPFSFQYAAPEMRSEKNRDVVLFAVSQR
ncbi:MAG: DUF4116 domain-containing protein, partial [Candidatus Margulisiibacteriota bacterium]